jgi:GntR family transcriptional regulator of vanillate catabolism
MTDPVETVRPVNRSRLVDSVVDHLRSLILGGDLAPGQTLLPIDLAARLEVSRTPLREAFRILEHEGFVRTSNGNNTLEVVDLTTEELVALYQVREVVDGLAARLAAQRSVAAPNLDRLEAMLLDMRTMTDDWPRGGTVHAAFHGGIAELSGNRHVRAQLPMIRFTAQVLARRLRTLSTAAPAASADLIAEGEADHFEILDAVRNGDGPRAERIARRHIRKTMRSALLACPSPAPAGTTHSP